MAVFRVGDGPATSMATGPASWCSRSQRTAKWSRVATRPILNAVARPNIGGPVVLAGAIALGAGIGRSRGVGLDREAAT